MDGPTRRVLVVSDLHLGGAPAGDGKPAFQMCTERGRERLAAFFGWVASMARPDVELVLAGDVVDFLSEERAGGFEAFTADDIIATRKLRAIFGDADENPAVDAAALAHTRAVWARLADVVRSGVKLTILVGNHDIELSLPGPRRLLLERVGPGRVELVYDNQAHTIGRVLIEHGNRYDDWNAVPHDALRRARSRISRSEPVTFDPLPGSIMVRDVVNKLKAKLDFVDLLKPETAALLPLLAFLAPSEYRLASVVLRQRVRAARVRYGADLAPTNPDYVGASIGDVAAAGSTTGNVEDDRLMQLADEVAAGDDPDEVGAVKDFFEMWGARLESAFRSSQLDLLSKVLREWSGASDLAFDPSREDSVYLGPAIEAAGRGFEAIVFGHTHLAKHVSLRGAKSQAGNTIEHEAQYLNTGTWADLMALPDAVLSAPPPKARAALEAFADDLAANRTDPWRAFVPTYADLQLDASGHVCEAGVFLFDDVPARVPISKADLQSRLRRGDR